jgi:hypothetical protein
MNMTTCTFLRSTLYTVLLSASPMLPASAANDQDRSASPGGHERSTNRTTQAMEGQRLRDDQLDRVVAGQQGGDPFGPIIGSDPPAQDPIVGVTGGQIILFGGRESAVFVDDNPPELTVHPEIALPHE